MPRHRVGKTFDANDMNKTRLSTGKVLFFWYLFSSVSSESVFITPCPVIACVACARICCVCCCDLCFLSKEMYFNVIVMLFNKF